MMDSVTYMSAEEFANKIIELAIADGYYESGLIHTNFLSEAICVIVDRDEWPQPVEEIVDGK